MPPISLVTPAYLFNRVADTCCTSDRHQCFKSARLQYILQWYDQSQSVYHGTCHENHVKPPINSDPRSPSLDSELLTWGNNAARAHYHWYNARLCCSFLKMATIPHSQRHTTRLTCHVLCRDAHTWQWILFTAQHAGSAQCSGFCHGPADWLPTCKRCISRRADPTPIFPFLQALDEFSGFALSLMPCAAEALRLQFSCHTGRAQQCGRDAAPCKERSRCVPSAHCCAGRSMGNMQKSQAKNCHER